MTGNRIEELRSAAAARGEELCALVPTLRMAAVGLTRKIGEAEDLVHDVLLQGLILSEQWDVRDLLPNLLSRMRNTFYTRTPLAGWTCPESHDSPEQAAFAAQVYALPAPEREAVILVSLLGASLEQACGLSGCTEVALQSRLDRAHERLGTNQVPYFLRRLREGADPIPA